MVVVLVGFFLPRFGCHFICVFFLLLLLPYSVYLFDIKYVSVKYNNINKYIICRFFSQALKVRQFLGLSAHFVVVGFVISAIFNNLTGEGDWLFPLNIITSINSNRNALFWPINKLTIARYQTLLILTFPGWSLHIGPVDSWHSANWVARPFRRLNIIVKNNSKRKGSFAIWSKIYQLDKSYACLKRNSFPNTESERQKWRRNKL